MGSSLILLITLKIYKAEQIRTILFLCDSFIKRLCILTNFLLTNQTNPHDILFGNLCFYSEALKEKEWKNVHDTLSSHSECRQLGYLNSFSCFKKIIVSFVHIKGPFIYNILFYLEPSPTSFCWRICVLHDFIIKELSRNVIHMGLFW